MTTDIENMVAAWAMDVGTQAAALATLDERAAFIARQRRQLLELLGQGGLAPEVAGTLADAAAAGAAKCCGALLAQGPGHPSGHA